MTRIVLMLTACVLFAVAPARALPELVNYQGTLTDAAGQPLSTAEYGLTFSLFDAATAGTQVWTQAFVDVPVVRGRFNVILGPDGLMAALSSGERFLEVSVDGGAAIGPRQQLLSAPYALRAGGVVEGGVTPEMLGVASADKISTPALALTSNWTAAGDPVSIEVSGRRPVLVGFHSADARCDSAYHANFRVRRAGSTVGFAQTQAGIGVIVPATAYFIDMNPPAGTATYTLEVSSTNGGCTTTPVTFVAVEL